MSKVLIGIDKSRSFRVYLTISTEIVEEARGVHSLTPTATAALGRVLTATGLMGLMLKNPKDQITVQFKGDGPAKMIMATADREGNVKGYIANPSVDMPLRDDGHLDVGGSLGEGMLTVIKDMGMKDPYVGKCNLVSGEIAEDLTAYYYLSEQQNTSVALGVKIGINGRVEAAGGMIIQMLPDFEEGAVEELERIIGGMKPITSSISEVLRQGEGKTEEGLVQTLLNEIFADIKGNYEIETLNFFSMDWNCDCSKYRFGKALRSIGKKELEEIIEEDGKAEIVCQFCEKKYFFSREELISILRETDKEVLH